ncbi:MAG: helix-turn-helix domain-containing protein [Phycisphaerae bacterium]|nr:helix-turn-helix domain-containing protein [Phycisphaerae bacterium]
MTRNCLTHSGTEGNQYHYLPINDKCIDWDLYLTGIGTASIEANSSYPPQGHPGIYDFNWNKGRVLPEYQILYISEGSGSFESSATGVIEVYAGSIMILFPEVWHRYKPDIGTGWKENWISINGEYLYRLANRKLICPENAVLHLENSEQVLDAYRKIWKKLLDQQMQNSFLLSAYAMEILALAIDSAEPIGSKETYTNKAANREEVVKDQLLAEAIHYIWSHSHRNTSIDDIVKNLSVTRRTLERKFNQILGYSIGQEITYCRIERAKHLLRHTSLPISHIALAVGFSGSDRLSKVFRKIVGITPGQYRKRS